MNIQVILTRADLILRSYGVRGMLIADQNSLGRYLTFKFLPKNGGENDLFVWDMPISNRSNSDDISIADEVAEHIIDEMTRPA